MKRFMSLLVVAGLAGMGSLTLIAPSTVSGAAVAAAKNANFKGTWTVTPGEGFVITKENRTTGKCKGTSDYGAGYGLTACKVTGTHYTFTITYGPTYKSHNKGVLKGNTLKGSFHDTNGNSGSYTGTRS
jgi:hypothetical protein